MLDLSNAWGIISNVSDTVEDLEAALKSRFREVHVGLRGTVALFEALGS